MRPIHRSPLLHRWFGIPRADSTLTHEVIGGLTTFLTMSYVIFVIPGMLSDPAIGMPKGALITATILASIFGTLVVGLYGKVPFAMAPGIGLGAYFAYSLCIGSQVPWTVALGAVFTSGVLFLILGLIGIRRTIAAGIPESLQVATAGGIGLFILFIGLKNMGAIVAHPGTLVTIGAWSTPLGLGLAGTLLCGMLETRGVRGGLLIGILTVTALGILLREVAAPPRLMALPPGIGEIAGKLDIRGSWTPALIGPIFALMFVDLFDSLSTMIACGKDSGILAGDPAMTRLERALKVDASATVVGSLLGVPTVTTYVECATGISAGARTGLASLVTAACFALTLLLSPVIQAVPAFATAPALVMAGVFMFKNVRHLEFSRMDELIPAVLTLILMPLTFNISVGIAAGFISWTALKILTGRIREIRASMWVCTVLALSALAEMMLPAGLPFLPR